MKRFVWGAAVASALVVSLTLGPAAAQTGDRTAAVRAAAVNGPARSIILFIGDGMGDAEITLARNYARGAAGRLAMDTLPFTGAYTTYSVEEGEPSKPDYVPDSAATGTAWATGSKTSNGRISTTAGSDRDLRTILELAQARGWRTGNVTTAELTDATPAVLGAHVSDRTCQGPKDMAACPQDQKSTGGPGAIAEQLVDHRIDVMLGGGAARFEQPTGRGGTVLDDARSRGYGIVRTARELDALQPGTPILGLFHAGNLPTEWSGLEALPYPSNATTPQTCRTDNRPADVPTLAAMTATAIRLLDSGANGSGFFLQVEGASIDKRNHAADPCGQIGETIALDDAVKVGLDYARSHPDTLVIVTADHGHTSQIVGLPTDADHPTGQISVLKTMDGAAMTVSYGTNLFHRSQEHTGTQVRIAAIGPQAANVLGVIDQTELFRIMARAMGVLDNPN
jgi:alkaline phosphatase/streptomycin-6-phosphatase